ncbi:MAG: hypothetical protein KDD42_01160 [Bdellovibrionales bacterium]|nr:hypothetical protein [Bdellovibrionales bacterium]
MRETMLSQEYRCDVAECWRYDCGNRFWAAGKGKPYAIYGEVESVPENQIMENTLRF